MMQKLFNDIGDIVILLLVLYITLVFFGLIKYPIESWRIKTERIKLGRFGNILKLALPGQSEKERRIINDVLRDWIITTLKGLTLR